MSGRRREVPLSELRARGPLLLRVDLAGLAREQTGALIPVGPPGVASARTFSFPFECLSVPVLEVLAGGEGRGGLAGETIRFVSLAVQRGKAYQREVERSGARRILWYDENAAFEEPLEGPTALLVLTGYDADLDAHCAPLGNGLLNERYLSELV